MTQVGNTRTDAGVVARCLFALLVLGGSLIYVGCCQTPTGVGWVMITATPDCEERVRYFAEAAPSAHGSCRPDFENPGDWYLTESPDGNRLGLGFRETGLGHMVFKALPLSKDLGVVSGVRQDDSTRLSIIALDLQSVPPGFSETVELLKKHQWGDFIIIEDLK